MYKDAVLLNSLHRDNNGMILSKKHQAKQKETILTKEQVPDSISYESHSFKVYSNTHKLIKEIALHGNLFFAFF